jgi:hypothetical protein
VDKLTLHAEALIASLAHDHGVGRLEPDADGLIVIDFDGESVALGFSASWNAAFLTAVLALDAERALGDAFRPFRLGSRLARRNTRLGKDGESGALVLIREMPLQGLSYPDFTAALTLYLGDLDFVRHELGIGTP